MVKKKRGRQKNFIIIEQQGKAVVEWMQNTIVTLAILCFAFGFALMVTSVTKLLESDNPWCSLLLGIGFMIIPVILGVWRFQYFKHKLMHNLKKLKID